MLPRVKRGLILYMKDALSPPCQVVSKCAFQFDKLEFVYMIPDTSLHQHNDVGVFDLDNLFCFQSDLFC